VKVLVRAATTLVSALMAVGCSSASHSAPKVGADEPAQSAETVATSCVATVSGANLSSWRTVVADKFTFCLPPDWHGRGHNWRATSATMEWGLGKARTKPIKVTEV
jgi:hypothetical protein